MPFDNWTISGVMSLTGQYQSVHIKDNSSEYTKLNLGAPQGSVLGPLLFSYDTKPIRATAAK